LAWSRRSAGHTRVISFGGACGSDDKKARAVKLALGNSRRKFKGRRRADAVRVTPAFTSNDGEVVRNWALAGLGVTLRSEWDVAPFVRHGELQRILTNWDFDGADVIALVPTRQGISARVTRFIDFLKEHFHTKPPWR
jgi:DNA-binding transcriptional LysR family regulator